MFQKNIEMFPITQLEQLIQEHPSLLLRVNEIRFSVRTQNCLLTNNINLVGDLVQKTESSLLQLSNFGKKSLKEIISTLDNLCLHLNTTLPNWPPENLEVLQRLHSEKISKLKKQLYLLSHSTTSSCLEEELLNIANQCGKRNAQIFIQRMGWDGLGGRTLDSVGKKYGMTRERVRQICSKIEKIIKLSNPPTTFTKQAIHYANQNTPNDALTIENGMIEHQITIQYFRIEGLITAAFLLGQQVKFDIEKVGRKKNRLAIDKDLLGATKLIKVTASKHVTHWGAATVSDIISRVEDDYGITIEEPLVSLTLEPLEGFRWLDQSSGWFWFNNGKRNRIINLIIKILSVSNKLSIDELRGGIMRPYRMRGCSPPKRVLKAICEQSSEFKVKDNYVSADPALNWKAILEGTNAYDLVTALTIFGPVLTRSEFETLCLNKGMNRTSFYMYLGASPLIQRYARGVYGLRGAEVSATTIEQLRKKVELETSTRTKEGFTSRVLQDYGRTPEGHIWIAYKLSDNSVHSGVITVPGSVQKYLEGEFALYSADKIHMGTLKTRNGSAWGLGPFFRRRGAEPRDCMLLEYNLHKKTVSAELGDEDLLERFSH